MEGKKKEEKGVMEYIASNIPLMDTINRIAFGCLGITTAWTANSVAMTKLQGVMPNHEIASGVIAVGIAILIAVVFDFGLRKNFISSLLMFNAKDFKTAKPSIKLIVVGFLFIAIVRFSLSGGATFISSIFISDSLVEDQGTEQLEKMLQDKEGTKQAITTSLTKQVNDIRKDAEKRASGIVNRAIDGYGTKNAKLWRANNSWIKTATKDKEGNKMSTLINWRKGIIAAEKQAEEIRKEASRQIADLQKSQTQAINDETNDKSFATITRLKANQLDKANAKETVLKFSLWMIDGLFVFIAVLSSFGLAFGIKCHDSYVLFKEETTLLDISREGLNASRRIVYSYMVAAVAKVDKKALKVATDLSDGTGTIDIEAMALNMNRIPRLSDNSDKAPDNPDKMSGSGRIPSISGPSKPVADNVGPSDNDIVIKTTIIKGVPYIKHKKRDGTVVKWTEDDVNKNLSTYDRRLVDAKRTGKQRSIQTNKNNINKMKAYLTALKELKSK